VLSLTLRSSRLPAASLAGTLGASRLGGGSTQTFGFIVKVAFSFEGRFDVVALKALQNKPGSWALLVK
jgi:hypothetical protein